MNVAAPVTRDDAIGFAAVSDAGNLIAHCFVLVDLFSVLIPHSNNSIAATRDNQAITCKARRRDTRPACVPVPDLFAVFSVPEADAAVFAGREYKFSVDAPVDGSNRL